MKRIANPGLILLGLSAACVVVYYRIFAAGFVGFDDEIHVYANPFLNPPSLQGVATLWQQSYRRLYIPLAYTIFAAVARWAQVPAHLERSIGDTISVDPSAFHVASVAFHVANTLVCFLLVQRLTRRRSAAWLCSLVFALHPLQLESVAWISELRGLTSGFFALLALYFLVLARQVGDQTSASARSLLAVSAVFVTSAMLCKPSAAVLPLAALAIDRTLLKTPWRTTAVTASIWAACCVPFALLTRSLQAPATSSEVSWWQRPFVAGDALAFYLRKIFVPIDLCIDYGRTPVAVLSQAWGYLAWMVPVALLAVCYRSRQRRPLTWLGALLVVGFLLPTLGLVPFTYQFYSTVADRYAYLALVGVGLMVADAVDGVRPRKLKVVVVSVALVALASLTFTQSRYWTSNSEFLQHSIDVNPDAAFAYLNRGRAEQANGEFASALADYQACVKHEPTLLRGYVNLAEVYFQLSQPAEAERVIAQSQRTSLAPNLAGAHTGLGIVLAETHRLAEAVDEFRAALRLQPNDPSALDNLKRAEELLERGGP